MPRSDVIGCISEESQVPAIALLNSENAFLVDCFYLACLLCFGACPMLLRTYSYPFAQGSWLHLEGLRQLYVMSVIIPNWLSVRQESFLF